MVKVIKLDDYKTAKQRQLIIKIYQFLNEKLDCQLDNILVDFDKSFIDICIQYDFNPINVSYFRLPIIIFIVTSFIKNSNICNCFPDILILENEENKHMFKNTLIKVFETFEIKYSTHPCRHRVEREISYIIHMGLFRVLEITPIKFI